jgi:hypothetical protein
MNIEKEDRIMQFRDKPTEFSSYRMLLAGINVIIDLVVVMAVAIIMPQIDSYAMCSICLVMAVATLIFQIHVDHTLIFTGQNLVDDGESLIAAIGIFGLGFGKKHFQNKSIDSYRYHYIEHVKSVDVKPFGIRVKADVYTATSRDVDVDKTVYDTPGAMKKLLTSNGKKRRVVFRIEHNLMETEEKRLLKKLDSLM